MNLSVVAGNKIPDTGGKSVAIPVGNYVIPVCFYADGVQREHLSYWKEVTRLIRVLGD